MDLTARFTELVQGPEADLPLDEAALLIAAHADPTVDVEDELRGLDRLAAGIDDPTLPGWRRHLFLELGFTGNAARYYDPANSLLHCVVRARTGLPITLSVLGMEVGRRVGLRFAGIGMPGHFLLRYEGEPEAYVDAFEHGVVLTADECADVYERVNGTGRAFHPSFLAPVGPRAILARMLANLKAVYAATGSVDDLQWVLPLRLAIPGVPQQERREWARVLGAGGRFVEAAAALEALADATPEDSAELEGEALAFRARLN